MRINGGFNGLVERQGWLGQIKKKLLNTGDLHQGAETGAPDDDVMWLQKSLNTLGADPVLEENGHMDELTTAAVRTFQAAASLIADGIPGPVTKAAIQLRLSKIR
jgi:peptidoglycan hydrolase-like protein with peptidoglycan-binding domain